MSIIQIDEYLAQRDELEPTDMAAFLAWMQQLTDSVPAEAWEDLPADGAEHIKDYLYGNREFKP